MTLLMLDSLIVIVYAKAIGVPKSKGLNRLLFVLLG